jgi:simple sugar transport system permease protein
VIDLLTAIGRRTLVSGTPLLLGTFGEILTERSGVMNLGMEGIMAVGAVAGFSAAVWSGSPWFGLGAAMLAGFLLGALHAVFCITLRANQITAGLALTTFGIGLSGMLGKSFVGTPLLARFAEVPVPLLSRIPLLGEVFFNRDPVFYLTILLGILLWGILFRTRWGLCLRSVGENPVAAETMGINVRSMRYAAVMLGGALAGAGGAYLSLVYIPSWIEGMTAGRGWIVIALTIFARWDPLRAFWGAYLFGGIFISQYFLQSRGIPPNLLLMLPYIATLVVLRIGSSEAARRRLGSPAALGRPY